MTLTVGVGFLKDAFELVAGGLASDAQPMRGGLD
jgi:hypothetical protein